MAAVIDCHLHVWHGSNTASFDFAAGKAPPAELAEGADAASLLQQMDNADVAHAVIIQPINYMYAS